MIKLALTTAAAVIISTSAFAASFAVTEIAKSGIKKANGVWTVSGEGDKVSGTAALQLDNGTPVTYKLSGKLEGNVYTLTLADRTDGKKDCVWTGKAGENGKVFEGPVVCGSDQFVIRAGVQQ